MELLLNLLDDAIHNAENVSIRLLFENLRGNSRVPKNRDPGGIIALIREMALRWGLPYFPGLIHSLEKLIGVPPGTGCAECHPDAW